MTSAEQDLSGELAAIALAMADLHHPTKEREAAWAAGALAQGDRVARDHASTFSQDDWQRCADRGLLAMKVPESMGGEGADLATMILRLEGLGKGCLDNGLAFALASQVVSTQEALVRFASPEIQQRWLPGLMDGSALGAFAMTEPEAGSDAYAMAATAVPTGDGDYVLNGHKAYITLGSRCAMVIVFASTRPDAGRWGLSAFVVPTDLDGVAQLPNRDKMGMRTTPFGDITLTDVVVPGSALLGREGAGVSIFNTVLEVERSFVFAPAIGATERLLDSAVEYATTRHQGGQPIGNYQAVGHRIADIKQQHETSRLSLYRAAIAMLTGRDVAMSAALAKLTASEVGISTALAASAVHGAKGFLSEFEVERHVRDALGGIVYSGTSDIQRNIIARLLGVG